MKSVLQRHTQSCVMVCDHVLQKFRTQGRIHVHTRKGAPSLPTRRSSLAGTLTPSSQRDDFRWKDAYGLSGLPPSLLGVLPLPKLYLPLKVQPAQTREGEREREATTVHSQIGSPRKRARARITQRADHPTRNLYLA